MSEFNGETFGPVRSSLQFCLASANGYWNSTRAAALPLPLMGQPVHSLRYCCGFTIPRKFSFLGLSSPKFMRSAPVGTQTEPIRHSNRNKGNRARLEEDEFFVAISKTKAPRVFDLEDSYDFRFMQNSGSRWCERNFSEQKRISLLH